MIVVEQAIYGEKQGVTSGHDLLAASEEKNELFKRVSGYTDLADRPEGGVLQAPIVRGLFIEDHFLLIKTFPDSEMLRSGRVFAHALFIRKEDLSNLKGITDLFRLHLNSIDKEADMASIKYSPIVVEPSSYVPGKQEIAAVNALLANERVVWLSEEGYWEWLERIWPRFPIETKTKLRIGAAFNPQRLKTDAINIVFVPSDSKSLWAKHSIDVIDSTTIDSQQSAAANWLVRNGTKESEFQQLLDDFSPKINSLSLLKSLQDYGEVYHTLDQAPKLGPMLAFANFITLVNSNTSSGLKGKERLSTAIINAIPQATVTQITALIHQTWKGFPNAIEKVSDALKDWLTNNLLGKGKAQESGGILMKALQSDKPNWWTETVLSHIQERLKKWQVTDAPIIWRWIIETPELATSHTHWLPENVETDLANVKPSMERKVAELVVKMSKEKEWVLLHAKTITDVYPPQKAIEEQLLIDTDPSDSTALIALSKGIKSSDFVTLASLTADMRLHLIAGELVASDRKLMKHLKLEEQGWQNVWRVSIETDDQVWAGIPNPNEEIFKVMDHILAGGSFDSTLLKRIGESEHSSLKDYSNRAVIWSKIPIEARSNFIASTIAEIIPEIVSGEQIYGDLEPDLLKGLQTNQVLEGIILNSDILLSEKVQLFQTLPYWKEHHGQRLAETNQFSASVAKDFGQLILTKNWKAVANYVYNERFRRKGFGVVIAECVSLLSWWQRMSYYHSSGSTVDRNTIEQWWSAFTETAIKLYPEGPNQNGLWERAGGDKSQLFITGSARTIWVDAIRIVRNQGQPEIRVLIESMSREYHQNEELKRLKNTL